MNPFKNQRSSFQNIIITLGVTFFTLLLIMFISLGCNDQNRINHPLVDNTYAVTYTSPSPDLYLYDWTFNDDGTVTELHLSGLTLTYEFYFEHLHGEPILNVKNYAKHWRFYLDKVGNDNWNVKEVNNLNSTFVFILN